MRLANGGDGPTTIFGEMEGGPRKPIISDIIKAVIQKGEGNKTPGRDGIGLTFLMPPGAQCKATC
jgi:hypothetical protein